MTPQIYAACAESVHVITHEGRVLRGGRASLFVLGKLGWGWLTWIGFLPPFVWLVELGYRIVAGNRHAIGRFFGSGGTAVCGRR